MLVTLAYCHRDIDAAARLLQWIERISPYPSQPLMLVASTLAEPHNAEMVAIAKRAFETVTLHVMTRENERGWPSSANSAFLETLTCIEQQTAPDDALWLEPDVVPITAGWLDHIEAEWLEAKAEGKTFMGAKVKHPKPEHMSGIAVYGKEWRAKAPMLLTVPHNTGWDRYALDMMPHSRFTKLIQHEWLPKPGARQRLKPETVLYHQCKTGVLMQELAKERGFAFEPATINVMSTRYFETPNATRKLHFQNLEIRFQVYDDGGGSIPSGILSTSDPEVQAAMDHYILTHKHPINEITQAEYEVLAKKKTRTRGWQNSPILKGREWSGKAAVPAAKVESEKGEVLPTGKVEDPNTVIQLGPVAPAVPRPITTAKLKRVA